MKSLLLSFLLLCVLPCSAQKAFKPVTTALKAKNYKEAIQQINKLRADSTYCNNAKLCIYSIEANSGLNDAQNMKIYLKQSYDTLAFFSTTRDIISEAVRLDSIERMLQLTENKKPKQTHYVREQLQKYFPNMNAAARYFYKIRNYSEAMRYLRTCLELPHTTLGQAAQLSTQADAMNAVRYMTSAYSTKQYGDVLRYDSLALSVTHVRADMMKTLALTANAMKDSAAYHARLADGWKEYPHDAFFFTRLADFYNHSLQYKQTLHLAQQQLSIDSTFTSAYMARCVAFYNLEQFDSCIVNAEHALACDSTFAEAHYYIGAAYINLIARISMPDNLGTRAYRKALAEQQRLYLLAEPELETYRRMAPQAKQQWAPLLYKVYLALNRGKKFAEIEALMQ